jgi:hypothetical protein
MSKSENPIPRTDPAVPKILRFKVQFRSRHLLAHRPSRAFLHQMPQTFTWLLAICGLCFLTACSTTQIQGSRTAASLSASPVHSVMVVGLDDRADVRAQFESDLVHFLQQRKAVAVGSFQRFPLSDFKGTVADIRTLCATAGTESLLLIRTTDRTTFERGPGYERAEGMGEIETAVQLKAVLYRASDGMAIWNGAVTTILGDQYNSRTVLNGVAKAIVKSLVKNKIIR